MAPKYRQQLQKAKRDLREQHDGEPPTQEVRELTRARLKEARTEAKATKRIQEREKTEQRLANEEKMDEAEFLLQEIKNLPEPFPADLHHKFLNDTDFRAAVQAVVLAMRRESKQHVKSTVQELGKLREQHVDVILWIVLTRKNKRFNFDNFFEQTRVKGFVLRTLVYAEGDDVTPAYVSWIDAHEEAYNTPDKYEARKAFVLLWSKLPAEWDILTWFEPSHWQRADFGTFFKRAAEMRREIKRAKAEGRIPLQIHVNKFRAAEEKLPNLLRKNAKKALKYSEDEPSGSSVISNKNAYTMKGLRHGLKASSHDGMLNKMADGMIRRTEGGAINKAVESYLAITLPLGEKLDVVLGVCTAGDDGEENMGL